MQIDIVAVFIHNAPRTICAMMCVHKCLELSAGEKRGNLKGCATELSIVPGK